MFQGILHSTSSLYHTMVQEVMKVFMEVTISVKMGKESVISIVQGSDDSGCMLSLPGALTTNQLKISKTMLRWKECISPHFSILPSVAKSSEGTHDLIEYNSEWFSRHKVIKPTFRWISACLEVSVTERFVDRMRMFNNVLTQCLEGGATTLECAVVQLNQASLHYMLMGFLTQTTSQDVWDKMLQYPDPLIGFFPCDFDISAGVTGLEFSLYTLFMNTSYGKSLRDRLSSDVEMSYSPEELPNFMKSKDLQSVRLKFSNMSIYERFLKNLPIGTYEEAIENVEQNPLLIFGRHTSWQEDQPNLILKVFSPMVKESISNISPMLRMAAASAYMQSFPCLTMRGVKGRFTFMQVVDEFIENRTEKPKASEVFPLISEFEKVHESLKKITSTQILQDVVMKKSTKSKVLVFDVPGFEYSVSSLCKRQWFGLGSIPLSSKQFKRKWDETVTQYPFFSKLTGMDGLRETCGNIKMSVVECKHFVESLDTRTRSVTLYDSNSKSKSLNHTLSRIYWPNVKVLFSGDSTSDIQTLRSKIFSAVSYWNSNSTKEAQIQNWIIDCKTLDHPFSHIPSKGHKLKVFHDYLNGATKVSIISKILSMKQGCIGSFVSVQSGYGINRSGRGIWLGQVCGANVELQLRHNQCEKIRVSSLSDSITLSKNLLRLINEFNCHLVKSTDRTLILTSRGTFSTGSDGTPVEISPDLKFSYADRLEDWDWKLRFSDFNLRLTVVDPTMGLLKEYTILSDSFTSRDWIPNTEISSVDSSLQKWSLGEAVSPVDISGTIGKLLPTRRGDFLRLMKSMSLKSAGEVWNLEFFRTAIINAFKLNIKKPKSPLPNPDDIREMEEIYNQISNMSFDDDELAEELGDWTAEMEMQDDLLACETTSDEDQELNAMIKMLQYGVQEEPYLDEPENSRTMPYSQRYFMCLNLMATSQEMVDFKTLVEQCQNDTYKEVPGLLGRIVSLVCKEFHVSNAVDDDYEIVDLEVTASILSDSITSQDMLTEIKLEEIDAKLAIIDSLIAGREGQSHTSLQISKRKYLRLKQLVTDQSKDNVDTDNYNAVMSNLATHVIKNKLKFYDQLPGLEMLHITILETLIASSLNKPYEELSEFEQARVSTSIATKVMNHEMVNLLKTTFGPFCVKPNRHELEDCDCI